MELSISSSPNSSAEVVVTVCGELDISTAPQLENYLTSLHESGEVRVVVDIGGVTFLDSTGIGLLLAASRASYAHGGQLRITGATGTPLKVLELTGVLPVLVDPIAYQERSWLIDGDASAVHSASA